MVSSQAAVAADFTKEFRESIAEMEQLRELREAAFAAFTAMGFPSQKNENWKYTSVAPIAGENWKIERVLPIAERLETEFSSLASKFHYGRNGFAALNMAFSEFIAIRIPKETVVEKPIELNFAAIAGTAIFPHVLVIAEAGSKATLVEAYAGVGNGFTNAAVQVVVEDNANLTHYRVQKDSPDSYNVGTTEVTVGRGSLYNATSINLGAAISRHDIDVKFSAEGGEAFVDGLYMLSGTQHSDTHSVIDHQVPNCVSHQSYKGVLNDKSRGVFNGIVFVRENASGTDAQQSNKNLLLSNEARVDTKPQLEIFNDDVKCSHGATVGQLEEEELFYLLTRGLPDSLARNLLTYGFAEEIIRKIGIDSIKNDLDEAVLHRLNVKLEV
jgi:Fe-S cluster assembly protein SufD